MKRIDNCYSCWFWEGQGIRQRGPKGICHRFPPMVTPRNPDGVFPTTLSTDWCGEWKRISLRNTEDQADEQDDGGFDPAMDDPYLDPGRHQS